MLRSTDHQGWQEPLWHPSKDLWGPPHSHHSHLAQHHMKTNTWLAKLHGLPEWPRPPEISPSIPLLLIDRSEMKLTFQVPFMHWKGQKCSDMSTFQTAFSVLHTYMQIVGGGQKVFSQWHMSGLAWTLSSQCWLSASFLQENYSQVPPPPSHPLPRSLSPFGKPYPATSLEFPFQSESQEAVFPDFIITCQICKAVPAPAYSTCPQLKVMGKKQASWNVSS